MLKVTTLRTLGLGCLAAAAPILSAQTVIVSESFGGSGTLNATTAETFDADIVTAGGSGTWVAPNDLTFTEAGGASSGLNGSAYLDLGTYITDAANTATGKFVFSVDLNGRPTGAGTNWLGISFFSTNQNNAFNFADGTNGAGIGTMIYRLNGDIDAWAGPKTTNEVGGVTESVTGSQTFAITVDLTPTGGYNGTDNFGSISMAYGATNMGSHTYTTAVPNLQYVGLTSANATGSAGYYSNFELTQVPEPSAYALMAGALALTAVMIRRRRS